MEFEWDELKNIENFEKHGISFYDAQLAFLIQKGLLQLTINIQQRMKSDISALEK